jgi:DNA invertase Pin-like site-specific DNA recombinase
VSPGKKPTKPIDIYVRYSQVGSRDRGSIRTLEEQEEACGAQLEVDGLEAGQVFSDAAVSGGKRSRPAFDQVLARARSGESGGFIVYDLTRFGRYRSMAQDIIELEKAGATFLAVKDKVDTSSPSSRAFLTIMEAMAVMYREQVEERLRTSQINAVARGVHISPNVPPGYNRGEDGVLVPDPQHKVTMAHAFKMAAQGKSRSEIAKYLTERKLPSAGRPIEWAPSRIGRLLANPVYKGQARYGEIKKEDAHEPIIDAVTWARAQREQADPELLISETSEWLLSGFVRCASCRYAMRTMPGRPSTIPVYRCHCTNAEAKCPHPVTISMKALDDYVFVTWAQRIEDKRRNMKDRQAPKRDDSDANAELEAANAAYAELQAAEDELDPLSFAKAETKLIERIRQAEERIAEAAEPVNPSAAIFKRQKLELMEELVLEGRNLAAGASPDAIRSWREGMARDIRAVFVRPAQTKGRGSKAEDRVKILWAGDELPEMPRRGVTFEPRPYVWDSEPQKATA